MATMLAAPATLRAWLVDAVAHCTVRTQPGVRVARQCTRHKLGGRTAAASLCAAASSTEPTARSAYGHSRVTSGSPRRTQRAALEYVASQRPWGAASRPSPPPEPGRATPRAAARRVRVRSRCGEGRSHGSSNRYSWYSRSAWHGRPRRAPGAGADDGGAAAQGTDRRLGGGSRRHFIS